MSPLKQMLAMLAQNQLKINRLTAEIKVFEAENYETLGNIIVAIDGAVGNLQVRMDKIAPPLKLEKKSEEKPADGKDK